MTRIVRSVLTSWSAGIAMEVWLSWDTTCFATWQWARESAQRESERPTNSSYWTQVSAEREKTEGRGEGVEERGGERESMCN